MDLVAEASIRSARRLDRLKSREIAHRRHGGWTVQGGIRSSSKAEREYALYGRRCAAGNVYFSDSSSAGSGTFVNNGCQTCSEGGYAASTYFSGTSTAANGTFINNDSFGGVIPVPGGSTVFDQTSTAGNSTLIAYGAPSGGNGGLIQFSSSSTGGTARVEFFTSYSSLRSGILDISAHNPPGVTIGSIEGNGLVHLGANNLTVGTNHLSTTFSGVIDGGGGSFTKVGGATLALTGANRYTGGTTIEGGKLIVSNMSGSGTGSGAVKINKGTLRGRGRIAGAVTLGTGSGPGAFLSPGQGRTRPRTFNIQSTLTFNSDAAYNCGLNSRTGIADKVVANGVTISGAIFSFAEFGNTVLSPGTVFTAINNTAGTPITGTFSNLADGSTLIGGSNTYQASYEGGDGNDLTLTVVP